MMTQPDLAAELAGEAKTAVTTAARQAVEDDMAVAFATASNRTGQAHDALPPGSVRVTKGSAETQNRTPSRNGRPGGGPSRQSAPWGRALTPNRKTASRGSDELGRSTAKEMGELRETEPEAAAVARTGDAAVAVPPPSSRSTRNRMAASPSRQGGSRTSAAFRVASRGPDVPTARKGQEAVVSHNRAKMSATAQAAHAISLLKTSREMLATHPEEAAALAATARQAIAAAVDAAAVDVAAVSDDGAAMGQASAAMVAGKARVAFGNDTGVGCGAARM